VSLKIYIAYGSTNDQVTALRLKALGAVNGLPVFVPPAHTRENNHGLLDPVSSQQLRESEIIVGVLTSAMSAACQQELNLGKQFSKKTIVICEPAWANQLAPYFPGDLLVLDPANPAVAESSLMSFLGEAKLKQDKARAILAMGTIALGLVLLASAD
jgi:hypothetical protein